MEYRSEGFAGSFTSFWSCWIDGGRDLLRFREICATVALGSVANALFSCSSLARRKAVDYHFLSAIQSRFECLETTYLIRLFVPRGLFLALV
jgi:hypothetical protein